MFLTIAAAIAVSLPPDVAGGFVDVATAAGLLISPAPTVEVDPPLEIDPYANGATVCAADLDRDGWTDILLSPTPGRMRVYINNRDGTFREEGVARGFGAAFDISGIAAGDLSNSGRTDVFLLPRTGPRYFLYVNDGTGHFTEQAVVRGADATVTGETHKGTGVGLVDFDRDGYLDIHVTEWGVFGTTDGDKYSVLLHNRGTAAPGHFVNVTRAAGLQQPHFGASTRGYASGWADFDDDGNPDLALIGDFRTSQMWWNNGDGTFTETRAASKVGTDANGMGLAIGDIDRDGRLDLFVTSFDVLPNGVFASANRLYRNLGNRVFADVTQAWGVADSSWGWGAVFFDRDNDGRLDLIATNGYSYSSSAPLPLHPAHILDARRDRTRYFHNNGTSFAEMGLSVGVTDTGIGHGVAALDYDNDGDEDLVIANLYGQPILYRNDNPAPSNRWLRIRLTGTVSNRDGYGTLVRATAGGVTQTALYAPTNAFMGQREPVLHLGLGGAGIVDTLQITWPGGAVQTLAGVPTNQVLDLVEPNLTTHVAPTLSLAPTGGRFEKGTAVFLRAAAEGSPAPTYTWLRDGVVVPDAHGAELRLRHLHPADAGVYVVEVTNAAGTARSTPIVVEVTADPARHSVARWWNEALLDAIRADTPNPPVHARNLFHLSAALWDAHWAYAPEGWSRVAPVFHRETPATTGVAAQRVAMSHAAFTVLAARFASSPGASRTLEGAVWLMELLGCDPTDVGTAGDGPAAVGNRIGAAILAATLDDGANERGGYADATGYVAVNEPLIVGLPGTTMADPNRWQPLSLAFSVSQNGIVQPSGPQRFVGSNAIRTRPFALVKPTPMTIALDPGAPPLLGGVGHERLVAEVVEVIRYSSQLDPTDGVEFDLSPAVAANHPLGSNTARGRTLNPVTSAPYAPQPVLRGDYGRVLAEFWADGPESETPPGHWNVLFNAVSDHPLQPFRFAGAGAALPRLEWDVRGYLALNGAMHDAACAAWTLKRQYDSARPISLIRHMGGRGQSSDPTGTRYDPLGLPLIPGLIEVTTAETVAQGGRHAAVAERRDNLGEFVGRIVVRSWRGGPADPLTQVGGVDWVLAERWVPYQRDTFVTPAFPGYVSGHSTFSRAGAEVLTLVTGSPFFPGGLGTYTVAKDTALAFERGPSREVTLQWATYHDAADEAGLSRLYGGIHISADDLFGRRLGARIGLDAFLRATDLRATANPAGGLVNVSVRGVSGAGERVLIGGFVAGAEGAQEILVRAVGPGLEAFGIPRELCAPDPRLELFDASGSSDPLRINDDWSAGLRAADTTRLGQQRGAFALAPGARDAADAFTTAGGVYTVLARSGATSGLPVELVEVYGTDLLNVSGRSIVGPAASALIAGFVVTGTEPVSVLVRGIGPALGAFGVATPLPDPVLRLHRALPGGASMVVAENDDWSLDDRASLAEVGAARVSAFPLEADARDAALFVQLPPGHYTAVLSGKGDVEGVGLIEMYLVR